MGIECYRCGEERVVLERMAFFEEGGASWSEIGPIFLEMVLRSGEGAGILETMASFWRRCRRCGEATVVGSCTAILLELKRMQFSNLVIA